MRFPALLFFACNLGISLARRAYFERVAMKTASVCAGLLVVAIVWCLVPGASTPLTDTETALFLGGVPVPDNPWHGPGGPGGNGCYPISGVICRVCSTGILSCGFNAGGECVVVVAGGSWGTTLGSPFWDCRASGDPLTTCKAASGTGNTWCGYIANPDCVLRTDPNTGLPTCTPQCVPSSTPASVCSNQG